MNPKFGLEWYLPEYMYIHLKFDSFKTFQIFKDFIFTY